MLLQRLHVFLPLPVRLAVGHEPRHPGLLRFPLLLGQVGVFPPEALDVGVQFGWVRRVRAGRLEPAVEEGEVGVAPVRHRPVEEAGPLLAEIILSDSRNLLILYNCCLTL